jgi:lysophospholipase L1-like esterase
VVSRNKPDSRHRADLRAAGLAVTGIAVLAMLTACDSSGSVYVTSPGAGMHSPAQATRQTGASSGPSARSASDSGTPAAARSQPAVASAPPHTSCRSVVHIGDSTSDGLVLPDYQPDAALRIPAQYRRVGVSQFIDKVSGARSMVETWHGFPNAYTVAEQLIQRGYHGCWVLALGTNDAADVAIGSKASMPFRIREMMAVTQGQPVLWVNVKTLLHSGPYSESGMRQWNSDLLQACQRYPNMHIYDWASVAQPGWFIPDGIHYTPAGYAQRARLIADALALGFPSVQHFHMMLRASDPALRALIQQPCVVQ